MSGAAALKKINARVKQLKKRHPGAKRSTLQKQAGREFKAGKLKKRKPRKAVRKKSVRRRKSPVRRRRVASVGAVKRRRVRRVAKIRVVTVGRTRKRRPRRPRYKVTHRVRRVSGMKKAMPLLLVGGGLLALYLFSQHRPATQTVYIPSGNATKDNSAALIIAAAQASGVVAAQIAKLVQSLNNSSASQVQALSNAVSTNQVNLSDDSAVQNLLANNNTALAGHLLG